MRVSTHIRNTLMVVFTLMFVSLESASTEATPSLCAIAESALKEASRLRGLPPHGSVRCVVRSKTDVEAFLRETIAKKFPPLKLEREQVVLRAVGLVPDDYDYVNGIIGAYVSQIGGYYDPDQKHFVMVDSIPASLQRVVAVHELTHALQDQYFDLNRFLDPNTENGDELMAHAAVAEGDANLVMREALREQSNHSTTPVGTIEEAKESAPQPVIPDELQEILLFPYEEGQRFVEAVSKRGGKTEREGMFRQPPRSTREILHPEEYIRRQFKAEIPTVDEVLHGERGDKGVLYKDTLGEFAISVLVSPKAAQGWRGDLVVVAAAPENKTRVVWQTRWDSEGEAKEFLESYSGVLARRYRVTIEPQGTELSKSKRVSLRLHGRDVRIEFQLRS